MWRAVYRTERLLPKAMALMFWVTGPVLAGREVVGLLHECDTPGAGGEVGGCL